MLGPNEFGRAVIGVRCLVLVDEPKKLTAVGLHIPDEAKVRAFSGVLLDAGLQARDRLHDHGIEIGDRIEYGRFAGIIEEWERITEGPHDLPDDAYDWRFVGRKDNQETTYRCDKTGAVRVISPIVVMNCDDIISSYSLDQRRASGAVKYVTAQTPDGRTQHVIERA
jgi:co-chaperonin GroES (HSP10)